jgi:hypothetical protein
MIFSVLTQPNGGRYQPRNIGAIWIEDASGKYIRTLQVWAGIREGDLSSYNAAAGIGFFSSPPVDAITGATLSNHQTHMVTWDLKDSSGAAVPDGDYHIRINTADDRQAETTVTFTKGPTPSSSNPPNASSFINMSIMYQ